MDDATTESPTLFQKVRPQLCGAFAALLWISVAFYNGFPVLFSDTGGYLATGRFRHQLPPFRSPVYACFTDLASFGREPWFIIVAQAAMLAFLVWLLFDYFFGQNTRFRDFAFLCTALILAIVSGLPWTASTILPDAFAGMIALSVFLLVHHEKIRLSTRLFVAAILALAVGSHIAHVALAAAFAIAVLGAQKLLRSAQSTAGARGAWLVVPIVVGALSIATFNYFMGVGLTISPARNSFLLGRLVTSGLAGRYLREVCPERPYVACRYLENMPRDEDEFLFRHPMLEAIGGHGSREIDEIVQGTIARYPGAFVAQSARQAARQFVTLATGDEVRSFRPLDWNRDALRAVFPNKLNAFDASRQIQGRTMIDLADRISPVHVVLFWMALTGCALISVTAQRNTAFARLFFLTGVFLAINAALTGAASGVFDRYQARVAWLMPLCACVQACAAARNVTGTISQRGQDHAVEEVVTPVAAP